MRSRIRTSFLPPPSGSVSTSCSRSSWVTASGICWRRSEHPRSGSDCCRVATVARNSSKRAPIVSTKIRVTCCSTSTRSACAPRPHERENALTAAITTRGLTKDYGMQRGLFDLDMEVGVGEVFGFLGPNGAGKTTTIRLLMGMIFPTRGSAQVFGLDCQREAVADKSKSRDHPDDTSHVVGASRRGGYDRPDSAPLSRETPPMIAAVAI